MTVYVWFMVTSKMNLRKHDLGGWWKLHLAKTCSLCWVMCPSLRHLTGEQNYMNPHWKRGCTALCCSPEMDMHMLRRLKRLTEAFGVFDNYVNVLTSCPTCMISVTTAMSWLKFLCLFDQWLHPSHLLMLIFLHSL